ncbi:MAG: hypothetical protein WC975_13005 [Phycisphaerae bacterium]
MAKPIFKNLPRLSDILHQISRHRLPILAENFFVRVYTLILLLIVLWAGYMAFAYLVKSVFWSVQVPKEYVEWQGRVDADLLWKPNAVPPSRTPLAHYHTLTQQFVLDKNNGCAAADCHSPIPHNKSVAMRSFSNFHATFLACQTCHEHSQIKPIPAVWVNIASGKIQDPPAILALMRHLEMDKEAIKNNPSATHSTILNLLKNALEGIGRDPLLHYLMLQIDTSEPGSPVWRHAVEQLTAELPLHLRGEYGAKIALQTIGENYRALKKQLTSQAKKYRATNLVPKERDKIYQAIHGKLKSPSICLDCHTSQSPVLDFKSLGYSPIRAGLLTSIPIASQVQHIQQGKPFYLPGFLEGGNER